MINPLWEKHARLLVGYCCEVKPGENVLIGVSTLGVPLARAVYREVVRAGGIPHLRLTYPEMLEDLLALAPDEFFDTEPAVELGEADRVDVSMYVLAAHNTRNLQGADKSKYARYAARNKPVGDVFQLVGSNGTSRFIRPRRPLRTLG